MNDLFESEINDEIIEEQDTGIWLSIGDLMSGLLMFFALLFVTAMVQVRETQEELQKSQKELQKYQEAFNNLPLVILNTFQQELPPGTEVKVDPKTGDVNIPTAVLFDQNSAELNPQGKKFLQQLIPVYSRIIFSREEFQDAVRHVIVEGHTSSEGEQDFNLRLSLQRAAAVTDYISSELEFATKSQFQQKLLAAGRGERDADPKTDNPNDRKVVFRFQLRRVNLQNFLTTP